MLLTENKLKEKRNFDIVKQSKTGWLLVFKETNQNTQEVKKNAF